MITIPVNLKIIDIECKLSRKNHRVTFRLEDVCIDHNNEATLCEHLKYQLNAQIESKFNIQDLFSDLFIFTSNKQTMITLQANSRKIMHQNVFKKLSEYLESCKI